MTVPKTPRSRGEAVQVGRLGLPASIRACLFDVDGVLTQTAKLHARAWKEMFDEYLRSRSARSGEPFVPFDAERDYLEYVDGKQRTDGVRSFLSSRGIDLPEEALTELGDRKNERVLAMMRREGVEPFADAAPYLEAVRRAGLRRAVVSASRNCEQVLGSARLSALIEVRVDGKVAERERLRGKPEPDTFLAAARALGVDPSEAAVFEDALAGVAAGRAGAFGYVVGVDRVGNAAGLRARGADVVVSNLLELLVPS